MQYLYLVILCSYIVATSGEEGRKALVREIELGKLLGENPQPNIVKFIGCVTTQGKSCNCGNIASCMTSDEMSYRFK